MLGSQKFYYILYTEMDMFMTSVDEGMVGTNIVKGYISVSMSDS